MALNVKDYRKELKNIDVGEEFFISLINCTLGVINAVRNDIKQGKIELSQDAVRTQVIEGSQHEYTSGKRLLPQMWYIKKR